jgi:hypothetical protein
VPRQIRGPRQRGRDLGGSLRRRRGRCVAQGGGSPGRGKISKRLHGDGRDGGPGARRGLSGWTRRARKRRGAFGGRTMRTLVPRRGEPGPVAGMPKRVVVHGLRRARTIRSHGAIVHGHAQSVGRRRAVPCAVSADLGAAAQQASGDQDRHQRQEQEPEARRRSQQQHFPHEAQDTSGHAAKALWPSTASGGPPAIALVVTTVTLRSWSPPDGSCCPRASRASRAACGSASGAGCGG